MEQPHYGFLTVVDADRRAAGILENLALVIADDDQYVEFCSRQIGLKPVHRSICDLVPLEDGAL